jgi:hypothetical protein
MAVAGSDTFASRDRPVADRDDTIDIFISYAREDQRAAIRLSQLLEAAGWTVWWDRRISTGKTWRFEIDKALQNARCVIVLWSQSSIHSQWVHEEAEEARQAGKLMPVLIEHVRPPPGFREVQTADLTSWDQSPSDPAFRQLNLDIGAVLKASPVPKVKTAEIPAPETTAPEAPPKNNRRKIVMALLATIIVFATGTVLISLTWNWQAAVERPGPPLAPSEPAEPDRPASERSPDLTEAPPRDLPEHKGEQTVPKEPTVEKPELPSETGARCADILHRLQLGELLSDQDRSYLQRECAR